MLALPLAGQAPLPERWVWFPISGGAVSYDESSVYTDIATGLTGVNTVTYYQQPRQIAGVTYNFLAERLEFECRGNRYRWSNSMSLDKDGRPLSGREDGPWIDMSATLGAAALYRRLLCNAEKPPSTNRVADITQLYKAMSGPPPVATAAPPVLAAPAASAKTAPPPVPAAQAKAEPKAEPKAQPKPLDLNALAASLAQSSGQPATTPSPSPEPKLRR